MLQLLYGTLVMTIVVFLVEFASRKKLINGELARKIPHVTLSIVFAILPFFIGLHHMAILAALDVIIVFAVYKFNWFSHARTIDRKTYGDYFFLLGAFGAALLAVSKWEFAAAMLILGIADTVAALVGKKYGKHRYNVYGNKKSFEGSLAFAGAALLVMAWLMFASPSGIRTDIFVLLLVPVASSFIEAATPYGLDNTLIPIVVVCLLRLLL